jgi:hypothetical protein
LTPKKLARDLAPSPALSDCPRLGYSWSESVRSTPGDLMVVLLARFPGVRIEIHIAAATASGVGRSVVVPSPSCPWLFLPQQ